MHWADRVGKTLLRRGSCHTIASGISISGHIHIGHSNDVFIADAVRRSVEEKGGKAEVIWYKDDFDPMRRVPWPLPSDFEEYLGMPYINIPSPDPDYDTFADFFASPFVDSLADFGIQVEIYSGAEVYREGKLSDQIGTALEKANEIRNILNKYRSEPLQEDWLPFNAICEECGRLATTRAYDWEGNHISYVCQGADYVDGCGHEGQADWTRGEGKLAWRVEWPARWKMLGVTCEPFGKDLAAAGGSYDTGKLIARRVFDNKPPEPIPYEWISLKGKPMSSSKGRVFTLAQWLKVGEPELLRYLIFRSKAMKAKNFDPGLPLLDLYDEYDNLEDIYFGESEVSRSKEPQLRRIYEISQTNAIPETRPQRIPFRLAAIMCQVARDSDHAIEILRKKGVLGELSERDLELARRRLKCAKNWIENHAPESARLKVLKELPNEVKEELSPKQEEGLASLASEISERELGPEEIHNRVYETARKLEIGPAELFRAIYKVLLGKESGPRVGNFIIALETDFVVKRFRDAVT